MSTEIPIRYQRLSHLSESQVEAIRAIAAHDEAAYDAIRAPRPVSMFLDEDVFQLEQARLFRRLPVAITPSATLAEPGSMLAHDAYGIALIVSRDQHGEAHVFLNACMHKGSTLVTNCEAHKGARITCPYHAWSWRLDGNLAGVARGETFDCLDKQKRNLVELPCKEDLLRNRTRGIGNEDFVAAEYCFKGLKTGVLDDIDVVCSGLEHCILMQYETLEKYMS